MEQTKRDQGALAYVAGVERRRERRNLGARGRVALLPRAWSRALIPFPHPFERLPRRPKAHRTGSGHQKLKERIQDFDWIPGEGFTSDVKLVS